MYPGHIPDLYSGEKPLIQMHHDESTFYANADQTKYWNDGTINILKQKSLGQAIMVSDFIEEYGSDYLRHKRIFYWKQIQMDTSVMIYRSNKSIKQLKFSKTNIHMLKRCFCMTMHHIIRSTRRTHCR